jgi:uncharacterized membrane protein YeaQ/YmgE (transglycosylase-associated protein family)
MMNFIVWLVAGAIIGWGASQVMKQHEGLWLNIVVGILGALAAGYVLNPLLHIGTIQQINFSLPALLVSLLGAIVLLTAVCTFRRDGPRRR